MQIIADNIGESPKNYLASYLPKVADEAGLNHGYELVVVATNHLQAAGAVKQYRHLAEKADFLLFTANWEGTGEIDALIPSSCCLWGFSVSSGTRDADGILYANIQKQYRISELHDLHTLRLEIIMEMFERAGLIADVKPDIIRWQWVHHAINAGLIGTALYMGQPSGRGHRHGGVAAHGPRCQRRLSRTRETWG
jgi:ketopantoate reductase